MVLRSCCLLEEMPLLLPAFFLITLCTAFITSPSPLDHNQYDGDRTAKEQMEKGCNDSRGCPENQYCHVLPDRADCQDCKTNDMLCQQDEECCPGWVCALSKCTERLSTESSRARCDPAEDQCAPGYCCSRTETLPFPICLLLPSEGDQCRSQSSILLKLITFGADYDLGVTHCPCAEGLVCTSKGNLISTCEKPDEVIDFTNYREDSLFQPIVQRDEMLNYYDADLVSWPTQDDQLAFADFPKIGKVKKRDVRNDFQIFNTDSGDDLKEENLNFDDHVEEPGDPSEADFQELKQLASEMGQYFGPGFY
ncbi:dickkopf-related protein 3-like isoform 2-T2 [Anomaloglossus baeobatrachus]|uniref:dickkopf-related protein 3-like isoform X2 n=1 Tax=Anomaloglossus baeobatrachus TaxID=238106 RepID=UPI003F4F7287